MNKHVNRIAVLAACVLLVMQGVTAWAKEAMPTLRAEPSEVALTYTRFLQEANYEEAYKLLFAPERSEIGVDGYRKSVEWRVIGLRVSEIVGCRVTFHGECEAMAAVCLRSKPAKGKEPGYGTFDVRLARDPKEGWGVSYGEEFVSRIRSTEVMDAVKEYGRAWAKRDYKSMTELLDVDYLKATFGAPPFDRKLGNMCAEWESEHGPFRAMSCRWSYVRYPEHDVATMPAKFCYEVTKDKGKFVPYLVTLRRDPSSKIWKISELKRTSTYQRPPEVQKLIDAQSVKSEKAPVKDPE